MLAIYFAHFVSILLYVGVITIGSVNLKKSEVIPMPFRRFFIWYIVFAILTCFVFIGLQIDWIFSDHNKAVGDTTAFWWLLFDFLNAMAYLSGMVALGVVLDLYDVYNKRMERSRLKIANMCNSCERYDIAPDVVGRVLKDIT